MAMAIETDMGRAGGRDGRALVASDQVEGARVRGPNGQDIGAIDRLVIEKVSGRVVYAVMRFGGFLGLGEQERLLPWSVLRYDTGLDAYALNLDQDALRGAPPRTRPGTLQAEPGPDPSAGTAAPQDKRGAPLDRDWEEHVHRYYNATPYWGI